MTVGLAEHAGIWRSSVVAMALALGGGNIAFAAQQTCLSGYEVSPGVDAGGGLTKGVTFVGIDNLPDEDGGSNPAICSFVGCLDDTHLNPTRQPFVFPPHIWGTLQLN